MFIKVRFSHSTYFFLKIFVFLCKNGRKSLFRNQKTFETNLFHVPDGFSKPKSANFAVLAKHRSIFQH